MFRLPLCVEVANVYLASFDIVHFKKIFLKNIRIKKVLYKK